MAEPLDLLIEGGTVIDGSGGPGFAASVGVRGGRLHLFSDEPAEPVGRRIDAGGSIVAPGFIDLHSHSGLMIFADPLHEPKVRQGVTTEVIGVDGLSYAPIPDRGDLEALVRMNAGLDGAPPEARPYDWSSVEGYLDRLDALHPSVSLAYLVGNSALRLAVMGWNEAEATGGDVADMRSMLREAMAQGAIGLSSGLDYPPGAYASTDELAGLTAETAAGGGFYHTHVRYSLGDRYLDPFREAIEIGRRGEGPTHITHFYHRQAFPGGPEPMLALVDDARTEGLDVTFDTYPYEWASTRLLIMIPPWVQSGGPGPTLERLADAGVRSRIRSELAERGTLFAGERAWDDVRLGAFASPALLRLEGRTLGDVIAERDEDPVDVLCDLLIAEDLRVNEVTTGPWSETLGLFLSHPAGMIGTDSTFIAARPSPRTYGSFPRVLGQFVREEALTSLEEAVRRMTLAPAARLGLHDRGLLRDGLAADIVVFDPERVRSNATYDDPRRFPDGISHVIVNGQLVVDDGRHTGARPGRVLRGLRAR